MDGASLEPPTLATPTLVKRGHFQHTLAFCDLGKLKWMGLPFTKALPTPPGQLVGASQSWTPRKNQGKPPTQ